MTRCPTCKKSIAEAERPPTFPFCSDRCKLIDLGRWLSGAYQIPVERQDDAGDAWDGPSERETGADKA